MADAVPLAACGRTARAPFRDVVVVCAKCSRKLDGGFGRKGREPLRRALKRALRSRTWGRGVRVVEVSCLDLCPRRRQVVATAAQLAAGRLTVVEPGADPSTVLDALLARAAEAPA